jgi:hypothetical protein
MVGLLSMAGSRNPSLLAKPATGMIELIAHRGFSLPSEPW